MKLIYEDKTRRIIKNQEEIKFSSFSSFHLIIITARVKGEKQINQQATDDEDLTVQIDGKKFSSPAAFSGGTQHNKPKTIYFLTYLKGRNHEIVLKPDQEPNTATLEGINIYALDLDKDLVVEVNNQAEDGDRYPWLTFVLDSLSLRSFIPSVTYSRRKRDSDDTKIIIDGKIQENIVRIIRHFLWYYAGSLLGDGSSITDSDNFTVNLPKGLHYIEFWADRMPTFHKLNINFGITPTPLVQSPTVDNPKWTGDFYDDSDEMLLARLIFGEAENQSKEARIWVAGSILNRVKATAWSNTIHEVILQTDQYDPFKTEDPNYLKIIDPLNDADEIRIDAWRQSYGVARGILSGEIKNPTEATHFHGVGISKDRFINKIVPNGKFIQQIDNTYFYWSPN